MSLLKQKPYSDLKIVMNEDALMQPTKERYRQLSDLSSDNLNVDKENRECISFFHSLNNMLLLFSVSDRSRQTNRC